MGSLRGHLEDTLRSVELRAACAGTHPFAIWQEIAVSAGERYQFVYGSMRELARREPTFAPSRPHRASRLRDRDPGRQQDAGAPADAAGAVGQLALLAGP